MSARSQTRALVVATVRPEARLSEDALARAVGVTRAQLVRLVQLGIVAAGATHEFDAASVTRLRRMLRLQRDLELDPVGASIIVDLLERLDRLEAELARFRGAPHGDR